VTDAVPPPRRDPAPRPLLLEADDEVPNNPRLPVLHYVAALDPAEGALAARFEAVFDAHGWPAAWRNGIFAFHHFHSTAHEVLGIYSGTVSVRLGGEGGIDVVLEPGDVVVLPAGVGHKKLSCAGALGVVGGYPEGQDADLCRPDARRFRVRVAAVSRVPVPGQDPVSGPGGPLTHHWGR